MDLDKLGLDEYDKKSIDKWLKKRESGTLEPLNFCISERNIRPLATQITYYNPLQKKKDKPAERADIEFSIDDKHCIRTVCFTTTVDDARRFTLVDDDKIHMQGRPKDMFGERAVVSFADIGVVRTYLTEDNLFGGSAGVYAPINVPVDNTRNIIEKLNISDIPDITKISLTSISAGTLSTTTPRVSFLDHTQYFKLKIRILSSLVSPFWGIGHPEMMNKAIEYLHSTVNGSEYKGLIPMGLLTRFKLMHDNKTAQIYMVGRVKGNLKFELSTQDLYEFLLWYYFDGLVKTYSIQRSYAPKKGIIKKLFFKDPTPRYDYNLDHGEEDLKRYPNGFKTHNDPFPGL